MIARKQQNCTETANSLLLGRVGKAGGSRQIFLRVCKLYRLSRISESIGRLFCLMLVFETIIATAFSEDAACLADRRVVIVQDGERSTLTITMEREFRSPDGHEAQVPPVSVRSDAEKVSVRWTRLTGCGVDLNPDGGWRVAEEGMGSPKNYVSEYALPNVRGNDILRVSTTYQLVERFAPGLWWASYAIPTGCSGGATQLLFRVVGPKNLASYVSGAWQYTTRALDNGDWEHEWRSTNARRPASDTAFLQDVPFIQVGKQTTWTEVGQGLREQVAAGRCEAALGAGGRFLDKSEEQRVLTVFEDLCTYRREATVPGFKARPSSDVSIRHSGDCKDLSVLLAESLEKLGVACSLVYRATTLSSLNDIMPCPYLFDHVFVAVSTGSGTWMLDPFAGRKWCATGWQCGGKIETHENLLIVPWRSVTLASN